VEAFAVSGFFSVRNPSHELRVKALVEEITRQPDGKSKPVTCGHELTTRLNAARRATTVALNARLISLLQELIATVRQTLKGMEIVAPLMVVKDDGSLVRAEWAMQRLVLDAGFTPTELIIPDHSEVANAVGAVAGGVVQQAKIIIRPLEGVEAVFRVHLSDGVHDFGDLEEGVVYAQSVVPM
jgi:N-methylhydantoinase A/oxoprolinase/acetone carboxylase beta subunit